MQECLNELQAWKIGFGMMALPITQTRRLDKGILEMDILLQRMRCADLQLIDEQFIKLKRQLIDQVGLIITINIYQLDQTQMNNEEMNVEMLNIIKEHFEDIDRLCQLLEEMTLKMKEMDERIHTLEIMLPKKDDDNEK